MKPFSQHSRCKGRRLKASTARVVLSFIALALAAAAIGCTRWQRAAQSRLSPPAIIAEPEEKGAQAAAVTTVPRPARVLCYDFGTASVWDDFEAVPGATTVRLSAEAVFGAWASGDFPDALAGDWATADRLRADLRGLRKGSYRGAVMAGNVVRDMVAGQDYQVRANGIVVVDEDVPPEQFFSAQGFFYGVQFDDLPGVDWWERYVKPVTPWRIFEFESTGRLALELDNCRLYALVVAPKADFDEAAFGAFLNGTDAARKAHFLFNRFQLAPERPRGRLRASEADRHRGYVTFSRHWGRHVSYNTVPSPREMTAPLEAAGTPGERLPVTFSIRALKRLLGVRVAAGDLKAETGVISADMVSVEAVRYKLMRHGDQWRISPEIIQKQPRVDIPAGVSKRWWLRVDIPEDAAPGVYRGTISIQPESAPPCELELALTVYPFKLVDADASFGVWYRDPWISSYCTGLVGGISARGERIEAPDTPVYPTLRDAAAEEYRLRMLEADMAFLHRLGFNGITVEPPRLVSLGRDGAASLDFSVVEAYAGLLEKYDINTSFAGQTDLMLLSRRILAAGAGSIAEFSAFHREAYLSALDQLAAWWNRRPPQMLGLTADEPAGEGDAGTDKIEAVLYYLELVREAGGIEPTVTLAHDSGDSVSWRPILDLERLVQLKPWAHTRHSLRFAREAGKPVRFYDGGFTRYAFGFHTWAARSVGHWQHAFNSRSSAFNPIWETPARPAVYPSPDGPLSTPRLERAAQGIVDYRYLRTLQHYINRAQNSGKPEAAEVARMAQRTLHEIRRRCTPWALDRDGAPAGVREDLLEKWRKLIAANIIRVQEAL